MGRRLVVCVLAGLVCVSMAYCQPGPAGQPGQGGRGGGRAMGPGGRGVMGPMMGEWLNELDKAYQANDREKMGQLIAQQKERMAQMEQMMGGRGPGMGPGGPGGMGPMPGPGGRGGDSPTSKPVAADDMEKKILEVLADMRANQSRGMMNISEDDGRVFRMLTEALGAKTIVEVGTSNGYSGIWWSLGLRKTGGKLITHEIDEGRAKLARENFKRAGVEGLVTVVMGDAHQTVSKIEGPIDILFLDADKGGYMDYMEKLLPKVRRGGLILAHNTTNAGREMQDYLTKVTTDAALETVFIHKDAQGVAVTLKKR